MNVLVLTLSFGSGHVRAARAVVEELERDAPQVGVRLIDALEDCRWPFRAFYVWPYWAMLRYAPSLWKKFFESRVARRSEQTAPAWAFRYGCPQVFGAIRWLNPETIVAVEVAACEMGVVAKRAGLTRARIVNVITDYEAEPVWVKPEVDAYAVADASVGEQLREWGAEAEKIFVSGIPTSEDFNVPADSRLSMRMRDDGPLVLLMGGGMGPTRMHEIAERLCASRVPMRVIAIAGHDARVHRRLARIDSCGNVNLGVLGWTEDVASLMREASVLVTKPGGVTLAEAARCGLPVVMFGGIPGPETVNAQRLVNAGAGLLTQSAEEAALKVEELLLDDERRASLSLRSRQLARPLAASKIADLALNRLEGVEAPRRMMA